MRRNNRLWVRLFLSLVIGGTLTWTLAKFHGTTLFGTVGYLALLSSLRWRKRGTWPSFSLGALLMLTGLIASAIVFHLLGNPWREILRFPGYEVNVAISPSGQMVACSQGSTIEVCNPQTGKRICIFKMPMKEAAQKANQNWVFKMAFTSDERALMTVDWQASPCLLDLITGEQLRTWSANGFTNLAVSGNRFVGDTSNSVDQCSVYDVQSAEPVLTVVTRFPFCRSLSPSGSHLLVGRDNSTAEVWHVDEKRLLGTIPLPQSSSVLFFGRFSRDGRFLVVPTDKGLSIWDMATFQPIGEWNNAGFSEVQSLDWSPDASRLVVCYTEIFGPSGLSNAGAAAGVPNAVEHCVLLDRQGNSLAILEGANAKFSPSGESIYVVNGNVQVFDGRTGQRQTGIDAARPFQLAMGQAPLCFSADGKWLVTNGNPAVFRKQRSETWYSVYQVPAFWGMTLTLTALLVLSIESVLAGTNPIRQTPSDTETTFPSQ